MPEQWSDLPWDIQSSVPMDPSDGRPLPYTKLSDGLEVCSAGLGRKDDGGAPELPKKGFGQREFDVGIRVQEPGA